LRFAPGQTFQWINLTIFDNDIPEDEKKFWVRTLMMIIAIPTIIQRGNLLIKI
jgi:hypothetical protein